MTLMSCSGVRVHDPPLIRIDGLEVVYGILDLLGLGGQLPRFPCYFLELGFGFLDCMLIAWRTFLQVG